MKYTHFEIFIIELTGNEYRLQDKMFYFEF